MGQGQGGLGWDRVGRVGWGKVKGLWETNIPILDTCSLTRNV